MAKQGFPLTPKMSTAFAWTIALRVEKADHFSMTGPCKKWFTNF